LGDAKRSNEELEQFAYIASHDLQEPLRQVVSYLQLIELRYKGKLDAEADEFIGFAVQGALRMQRMIEDLLTYSRAGARDTPRAATDLEQVFNHVLAEFKQSIEASGATVTWDALPKVNAEQMVMGRLFRYLVGNALKFKGDEPPEIHIGAERTEKEWQFSVRDNGIGIDPIYFDRIFSIFDRLHTNQEYPGTGIGLALCKRIVQGYGGRIWVDSEPGAGSTFSFTIPDRDLGQGKRGASSVHPGGREQAPRSVLQGRASN
ncbi:MAG: ATP-binding protein, partial [Anaerolineales bacterium]